MIVMAYRIRMKSLILGLLAMAGAATAAWSQGVYPDRPIRLIIPFAAGGAPDIMARSYAEKFREQVGQPVIVDNRPGATGAIGADAAIKALPDGYTLLLHTSTMVVSPWVMKQPFDALKDLIPVVRTAETSYLLTVSPNLPVRNLEEFVAYAKKHPGKTTCGTHGIASLAHLSLELLNKEAGLNIVHVPYKTTLQAMTDLFSGQLTCSIDPPTIPAVHVRAGKLRAIAHTGNGILPSFEGLDAIGTHYPMAAIAGWQAIFVHAATSAPIVARLREEWRQVVASPVIVEKIRTAGFEPVPGDSIELFSKTIRQDHERFGRIIKETGIRLD